jgi:hypothetical protein
MKLRVRGIATEEVRGYRRGGKDGNGQAPQVRVAESLPSPCRHCLDLIAEGDKKLVLAYRPFKELQPYAETGPIFLHANDCLRYDSDALPPWFDYFEPALVRGYGEDDWIRYETGRAVPGRELAEACRSILEDRAVAYVHIRSVFNCFQCRVDRS